MNINIKTICGDMNIEVDNSFTIKEVIAKVIKNFALHPRGHYALGKQNHVFVEFEKKRTLGELGINEGDVLYFIDYGRME